MEVIISNIAAIFVIMGVGFFANKSGLLPEKANDYLSPLLIKITSPCMIFNTIVSMDTGDGMLKEVLTMMAGAGAFFALLAVIGWFLCVKVMKLGNDSNCGVYIMLFATVNNGFMGLPITLEVFGEEAMFFMVFFQMMLLVFVFGPGIAIMNYGDKKESGKGSVLKNMISSNTVAAVLGIIVMAAGLSIPGQIMKPIGLIGDITTALSMLVIGIQLGTSNFRKIMGNRSLVAESVLKMILAPAVTFLLVNWLPISGVIKLALVFGAAFPSAVIVSPVAFTEGKDGTLAAEGVALTTLISVLTIPAAAVILSAVYL
ncbi:MAG: AEC family transporter [Firmicutes bacterium]|nr:AEC family transporter [Bacillota bacterium]